MELPCRDRGDELLIPGEMIRLRNSLRNASARHDLTTVIACAFDHRTQMLPFFFADMKMAPAGVRALGAAMVDVGFPKTRIVLQQWNRNFRPSQMRLDGRIPDLFMVSSMAIHATQCDAMIRDACRIDPARRPLIIAGGPRVIYEPWAVFSAEPDSPWGADVAVTGEEYVLLSLLEVLLSVRAGNEPLRSAFQRARDSGALDGVPGLVYAKTNAQGVAEELVDTGIQRLLGDLDELPHAALGYRLLEPPSSHATLGPAAIPAGQVHKHARLASLVMTQGCRFRCPYCPIPAYNQRQLRGKSGERIADEIERIFTEYDIRFFFGTDDNFFADRQRALEIAETLARKVDASSRPHCKIRMATEATIQDTLKMREQLAVFRKAGLWALWLGVEDMSGTLVKKGQSEDRTVEAFHLLRQNGIFPVPMLMHHDAQPLYTWRGNQGLLNQLGDPAEGRRPLHAGPHAHALSRFEILRRRLHFGAGLQERRRSAGRAGDDERHARDCFSASAPVDQTTQSLGSLRLFLQPAAIAVRPGLPQEPDPSGRRRNLAARRGWSAAASAKGQTLAEPQIAGPFGRRGRAGIRYLGTSTHVPADPRLDVPSHARQD